LRAMQASYWRSDFQET